jgi:hypothetical protein
MEDGAADDSPEDEVEGRDGDDCGTVEASADDGDVEEAGEEMVPEDCAVEGDVEYGVEDEGATEVKIPEDSAVVEGTKFEEVAAAHDVCAGQRHSP